jgi:hypothetical protein
MLKVIRSYEMVLQIGIELVEEALKHTLSPVESIPFLLRKLDCEMSMGNPGRAFETGLRYYPEIPLSNSVLLICWGLALRFQMETQKPRISPSRCHLESS